MTVEDVTDMICREIDRLCEPVKMSQQEALEFYELIVSHCEGYADAIREEMGDE